MKKIIYTLGIIAVSAFAFSACQKEQATTDELPESKLVTITFSAEKAGLETKTAAVEGGTSVSYIWTDDDIDNIKLFTVTTSIDAETGNETESLSEVANPTVTKVSDTKLTISGKVAPNATYKFRAILCDPDSYTGSGTNYSTRKPKTKATQAPDGTDNFDPTADILVSDDMVVTVGNSSEETIATDALEMSFRRQIVISKMTLKNLGAGEKVSKVVVTSTTGDIQGYLNNGTMSGQSKVITLNYSNEVVPANGEFPVYFVSMNNEGIALTVDVTTDKYTYEKSFTSGKSIDLVLGQFTKFNVALPAGTPVTTVSNGDYFITGVNSNVVYAAKAYISGNNLSNPLTVSVDADNETIDYVTDIEDCIFTLTRVTDVDGYIGKYTIQDANGLYLYAAGGTGSSASNHLKGEAAPDANGNAYWDVSKNANGTYTVESAGNAARKIIRFNYNNGSPMFSCYASGQTDITLYPASWCTIDTTPVLTIETSEQTKSVLSAATSVVFNYTANRYASEPVVTVTSDTDYIIAEKSGNPDITIANGQITVGLVANTDNTSKTATLSVTSTGLASAVTLTINQDAYVNLVSGHEDFDLTTNSYTTGTNEVTWSGTAVTIHNSGTNATNYLGGDTNNRTSSRFYINNTLTITPASGYTITSVVFTATSGNYANVLAGSTWSNASASANNTAVTVTPVDGTAVISATVGGTCGFTSIVVNYLTAGSGSGTGGGETDKTVTIVSTSTSTIQNQDSVTETVSPITCLFEKAGNNSNGIYESTSQIRMYVNNTVTISGATIKKVVVNCASGYNGGFTASPTGTTEKDTTTWTWEGSTTSLVLTASGTSRITSIEVTYAE